MEFSGEGTAGRRVVGAGRCGVSAGREAGLHPTQLYKWRRQLCSRQSVAPDFAPVRIVAEAAVPGLPASVGVIEIEFAEGTRLRISGAVDAVTVSAAVGAFMAKARRS